MEDADAAAQRRRTASRRYPGQAEPRCDAAPVVEALLQRVANAGAQRQPAAGADVVLEVHGALEVVVPGPRLTERARVDDRPARCVVVEAGKGVGAEIIGAAARREPVGVDLDA